MPEPVAGPILLVVPSDGGRLDQYLAAHLEGVSRTGVRRLIGEGRVLVNGRAPKVSLLLKAGDEVTVDLPPVVDTDVRPEAMPLAVVYESDAVVVVDKPAGVLTHPTSHDRTGTLVNAILYHYPEVESVGPPDRRGVVHRLDRDTSGLVIFGRTAAGLAAMQEQFRRHDVWKTYLALVVGKLVPDTGVITAALGRHPKYRSRQAVLRQGGRPARTQYTTLESLAEYSLVQAHPLTGRTHQIRVHLAALGHPVAGDPVYGRGPKDFGLRRQFLHAHALRFRDPESGETVELMSDLPADLQTVLEQLRSWTGA